MGNSESNQQNEYRARNVPLKLPMPDSDEINEKFEVVLASINLDPDKVKVLTKYDDEMKWKLICGKDQVQVKNSPSYYIQALVGHRNATVRKSRFKKRVAQATKILLDLEISLRTNHIGWIQEFLNDENRGLDVLVNYLASAQYALVYGHESSSTSSSTSSSVFRSLSSASNLSVNSVSLEDQSKKSSSIGRSWRIINRRTLKNSTAYMEREDIHLCIMCLRAIMNYQYGFNLVLAHPRCINEIALSLNQRSLKTKSLVLELLAAICLVSGGHGIILRAFDNFKAVCGEPCRFTQLMSFFKSEAEDIDFMVSCMQFINIIVHSVEDMNFRVYLQYEFTLLGLNTFLQELQNTKNEALKIQLQAYLDNVFDVATLLEDSAMKTVAFERIEQLEEHLLSSNERFQQQEYETMTRVVQLEKQLSTNVSELSAVKNGFIVKPSREELETHETEKQLPSNFKAERTDNIPVEESYSVPQQHQHETRSNDDSLPVPLALPPSPPTHPPPPPPISSVPPPPPPVSGIPKFPGNLPRGIKAKQRHHPKYRLPLLNWSALKPNQIVGTIFNELDDDSILNELDMGAFEDAFKTKAQDTAADRARLMKLAEAQQKRGTSLIDVNRARNLSITLRKIGLNTDEICRAVSNYDLSALPLEYVEMLPRFIPSEAELKSFKEYEKSGKAFKDLAAEDSFIWQFGKIERLQQRLSIMIFLGSFNESILTLTPHVASVIAASMSIKSSGALKKVLEIILAFGNYMNSSKRGPVYGFKLQSLGTLVDTKSTDKKQTLLHYIVHVIDKNYPSIKQFYNELRFIDKACKVSLENIMADVRAIKHGIQLAKKEHGNHHHPILKKFLEGSQPKANQIVQDSETAQKAYKSVVEYFGETPKTMPPETFFPMVNRFIEGFQQAEKDLSDKRIADEKRAEKERKEKQLQEERLKKKKEFSDSGRRKLLKDIDSKQQIHRGTVESKDGAIEDMITFLKSEPYRRHRISNKSVQSEASHMIQMSTVL